MKRLETVFLHDPDQKKPFRIVHDGAKKRYVAGSDIDTRVFSLPMALCESAKNLAHL